MFFGKPILRIRPILTGIASFIPGLHYRYVTRKGKGGGASHSPEYCFDVWMKHLNLLCKSGVREVPHTVAELGPGNSLGVGIAALLSGATVYYALDLIKYTDYEQNIAMLDKLVEIFHSTFARHRHSTQQSVHSSHLFSDKKLAYLLSKARVDTIRKNLKFIKSAAKSSDENDEISIQYIAPWYADSMVKPASVDMIYSQAVLEHIDDLADAYRALSVWIKPGGHMTHEVDYRSHNITNVWNGHWTCPELLWKIIRGRKPYLINRQPLSTHLDLLNRNGFKVAHISRVVDNSGVLRKQLAKQWQSLTNDDLTCSIGIIHSVRI